MENNKHSPIEYKKLEQQSDDLFQKTKIIIKELRQNFMDSISNNNQTFSYERLIIEAKRSIKVNENKILLYKGLYKIEKNLQDLFNRLK